VVGDDVQHPDDAEAVGEHPVERGPAGGSEILGPADVSPFAGDGIVEELGPDRCRLILGSWSWVGLAATVGRFDADIEVVRPTELRDAFARLSRRYADAAV
jgi:hypothetical protein